MILQIILYITYYNQVHLNNRLISIAMEYEIYTVIRTLGYSQPYFKTLSDFRGLLIFRVLQVIKKLA